MPATAVVFLLGSTCGEAYARLATPYYTAVTEVIAQWYPLSPLGSMRSLSADCCTRITRLEGVATQRLILTCNPHALSLVGRSRG